MKRILLINRNFKDINPMECGEEECAQDFRAGPTSRQYYLLHFILSGKGTFYTDKNEYTVTKGQMFIMHPHEVVRYNAESSDPWHYCWVGFEMNIDSPVLNSNSVLEFPQTEHIFKSINTSEQMGEQTELFICGKICELLSVIEQSNPFEGSKPYKYVSKVKQYIDINYSQPITIDQIAHELNINRSYLSTIFNKYIGRSPQKYLMDVRLSNAAELIVNHDYSVSDAALNSGYTDIFNFSKMFKQKFGVAPTNYKKKKD